MPSAGHQHAISMPSASYQQAISRPSAGHQQAISRPSAGKQQAISRQTAGKQQANSRPAPRTPARAVAVEGARAWVHPAADPVARRLRRARCRRRCTPPDEGRNQMHSVRPSATAQQAGSGVVHLPLSPSISIHLPLSRSGAPPSISLHLPLSRSGAPTSLLWSLKHIEVQSEAIRGAIRSKHLLRYWSLKHIEGTTEGASHVSTAAETVHTRDRAGD